MQSFAQACEDWDEWDKPAEPFLIHGNTWYVGTCISAILIEGDDGLVLIDTGTAKGSGSRRRQYRQPWLQDNRCEGASGQP